MLGTHSAFELICVFNKCERTSLFFRKVSLDAHEAFQKPLDTTTHFSKPNRGLTPFLKSCERMPVGIFIKPIGKSTKNQQKIEPIEKREFSHTF